MQTTHDRSTTGSLATLCTRAARAGVPDGTAREARMVTASRFAIDGDSPVSRRAESYFWGVVRRRTLRGAAPRFADSLLALSLATELASAGHGPEKIRREVARIYGEPLASAVVPAIAEGTAA